MSTEAPEQVLNFLLIPSAYYMLSTADKYVIGRDGDLTQKELVT